ncbi:MAG: hypothetical protein ACLFPW_14045, partial [Spirochaetaceae bacterium]
MKSFIKLLLWLFLAATVLVFSGCGGGSDTTISDRINAFEGDVNAGNFGNLWTHFHPDSNTHGAGRKEDVWTPSPFSSSETYEIEYSVVGNTAEGTITGGIFRGDDITFQMKNDPEDGGGLFGGEVEVPRFTQTAR